MRISWNWLRTLIDIDGLSPKEVADVLTSTGLEVESVEPLEPIKGMLQGVVVGHVLACEKHPDADRLNICQVDLGNATPAQIVCGAPNVAAGQKVLVATVGTTLQAADGTALVIKKAKIRGVESNGMICAEDELGLGAGHAGIMVLDAAAQVGTSAADQLELKSDHVFEIGLTPNRADAMSHWGVARDLSAAVQHRKLHKGQLKWPAIEDFGVEVMEGALADMLRPEAGTIAINVQVDAPQAAPRYAGLSLTHVRVGASPAWLQERLKSIGLKPINNVVDVTNFVQHELGQPLHAFDASKLRGAKVMVRFAKEKEPFTTLDGKERSLSSEDLVIADAEVPACLAGVFGGAESGVSDATTHIFLESAWFDAVTIRRTARRHGLNTDASFRFERGVDPDMTLYALKRAAILLHEVAGARVASDVIDLYPQPATWKEVHLTFAAVDLLCGVAVPHDDVVRILELLECRLLQRDSHGVLVQVPPYRVDVNRAADLVEEILRIHGFDQVPLPSRLMVPPVQQETVSAEGFQRQFALHLSARGFREVMTPSLVSGTTTEKLNAAASEGLVRLRNPLSNELDVMRPTMLFGLLQVAAHNAARQQRDLRLFERGRIYGAVGGRTLEQERTALLITGKRWQEQWRSEERRSELADLKEETELLIGRAGLAQGLTVSAGEHPLLGATIEVRRKKTLFALIGEVNEHVRKAFDLAQPAFYAEFMDEALVDALRRDSTTYAEVSKFPAVRRDLSLLLDQAVTYAQLEKVAFQAEQKLLRAVDLFDVYEGDKLPAGKKSYAMSFILQDNERTLTDEQVDKAMGRIRSLLEKEAGAELRG